MLKSPQAALRAVVATLLTAFVLAATPARGTEHVEEANGLRLVTSVPFEGGSEIAADDRFVYANQMDGTTARGQHPDRGGFRILSHGGSRTKVVGTLRCPGNDNDVQPIDPGLVVMVHHTNHCNPGHGLMLIDTSRPRAPRVVGRLQLPTGATAHTVTPHPHRALVYVSPGGTATGGGEQFIVDVSDPRRPRVAATFVPGPAGCHDLSMLEREDALYAFCAGLGETSIWDLSDPLAPDVIGRIFNPAIEFMYVAQPSPDGDTLAIVDEAFAGHECAAGAGPGGVWLYDITDLAASLLVGRVAPPQHASYIGRPDDVETWCASHGIAWHPDRPGVLAVTWYAAGLGIYDVTTPAAPEQVASFVAPDSLAEAVVWHDGLLYSNDLERGVDVFAPSF